jgi:hypothetical protein
MPRYIHVGTSLPPSLPPSLACRRADDVFRTTLPLPSSLPPSLPPLQVPNASYWQDFLPDDSLYIWDPDAVFFGTEGQVKLAAAFYVVACDGGAGAAAGGGGGEGGGGVEEKQRMYRVAGGDTERYASHSSFVSLDFSTTDGEAVGRFVKSLLAP